MRDCVVPEDSQLVLFGEPQMTLGIKNTNPRQGFQLIPDLDEQLGNGLVFESHGQLALDGGHRLATALAPFLAPLHPPTVDEDWAGAAVKQAEVGELPFAGTSRTDVDLEVAVRLLLFGDFQDDADRVCETAYQIGQDLGFLFFSRAAFQMETDREPTVTQIERDR